MVQEEARGGSGVIRVARRPEPERFDERVRQPGRALLRVLIGQSPPGGRWHKRRPIADRLAGIPTDDLYPRLWQGDCLQWLCDAYDDTCAYLAVRIWKDQSYPTVDHFIPLSEEDWGRALAY